MRKSGITYYNNKNYIIFKKRVNNNKISIIKNLFLFNIIASIILIIKKKPNLFREIIKKKIFSIEGYIIRVTYKFKTLLILLLKSRLKNRPYYTNTGTN